MSHCWRIGRCLRTHYRMRKEIHQGNIKLWPNSCLVRGDNEKQTHLTTHRYTSSCHLIRYRTGNLLYPRYTKPSTLHPNYVKHCSLSSYISCDPTQRLWSWLYSRLLRFVTTGGITAGKALNS